MTRPGPVRTCVLSAAALFGLLTLSMPPALAQQVIPTGSEIAFTSRQMGVPVDGQFRRWSALVQFDLKKPEVGKVAFTIDMGSATLGAADTDAEVAKSDWFNTSKFPQAQFQSSAIKATGKGRYEVSGALTIKGATQPVMVPVTLSQTGSGTGLRTTAAGTFTIKRLAFKIGEGPWGDTSMVADEVQVKFNIQLSGLAPL
ncbi:MAG: YceI family protein [Betaproteobacteria bacterium]|nr:YceI family protein [Betaproteobacteria bacterium]